jgi:hypothetical protein
MHKDTKKNYSPKVVRFYYANDNGDEYLLQCKVSRWERDDPFGSLPEIVTEVEIERAENEQGFDVATSCFSQYDIDEIECMAGEHAYYDSALPRFFANELDQAEAYEKEMHRQLNDAEYYLEQAEFRFKDAERRHKDALNELKHVQKIQSVPA